MAERSNTGGTKDFVYSQDDDKRIRGVDTKSTAEFKEAYKQMQLKIIEKIV